MKRGLCAIAIAPVLIFTGCTDLQVAKINRDQFVIQDLGGWHPEKAIGATCARENRKVARLDPVFHPGAQYERIDVLVVTCAR